VLPVRAALLALEAVHRLVVTAALVRLLQLPAHL
jgi:hypothetical protein